MTTNNERDDVVVGRRGARAACVLDFGRQLRTAHERQTTDCTAAVLACPKAKALVDTIMGLRGLSVFGGEQFDHQVFAASIALMPEATQPGRVLTLSFEGPGRHPTTHLPLSSFPMFVGAVFAEDLVVAGVVTAAFTRFTTGSGTDPEAVLPGLLRPLVAPVVGTFLPAKWGLDAVELKLDMRRFRIAEQERERARILKEIDDELAGEPTAHSRGRLRRA